MNEITKIQAVLPCTNLCIRRGTENDDQPAYMGATHGLFCDRCYYRTKYALEAVGGIVEHIMAMVEAMGGGDVDDSQKVKGEPPVPFNIQAFNDANETYSRMVYWSSVWAARLGRPTPTPAAKAWRTDNNRVVGLPADISPSSARYAVSVMAGWLAIHLDDICALQPSDDVAYFHQELKDIWSIKARWPVEEKPRYSPMPCQIDGCVKKIAIYPPQNEGDDRRIICEPAGHIYDEETYEAYLKNYSDGQKAIQVTNHLMSKYV